MSNSDLATPTQTVDSVVDAATGRRKLYAAMWRWHFYAGLLSIPLCTLLGVTGSIYLFKPFVEPWLYHDLQTVTPAAAGLTWSLDEQVEAAVRHFPNATPGSVTPGRRPEDATEVSLRTRGGQTLLVYINPYNGALAGHLERDAMFMQQVRELHGELMMGVSGSAFVEITACWTIILIITGLYLWWPRAGFRWGGVLIPRLRQGARIFWRDLHAVVAMYVSAMVLVLLVTGLPWTGVWGGLFKQVQLATSQNRPAAAEFRVPFQSVPVPNATPLSIVQAVAVARELGMIDSYTIHLPRGEKGVYGFVNRAIDLSESRFLYLDQYSGQPVGQADWSDHPATAKAVALGIRLHQGELFGVPNLLLMLCGALGAIWMSVTAAILWWKRRPVGKLGVPPRPDDWRIPRSIAVTTVVLGCLLPLAGVSLIVVFLLERTLLRKLPQARVWLGLA